MAKKSRRKKRPRRQRREALVYNHLERVSRELLERHPDIVRKFIGRNAGVYALYRRDKLYYVGLATKLRHRLNAHGKNRHGNSWDRFSIYLTIKDQHLREIEALLLRIANPPGIRQRGRLAQSRDMRSWIQREIRKKVDREMSELFQKLRRGKLLDDKVKGSKSESELIRLFPRGAQLRGLNGTTRCRARIRRDGRVRFNGKFYNSLSQAAKVAAGHSANGWWFWTVKRGGVWVRLRDVRSAGIPVYPR